MFNVKKKACCYPFVMFNVCIFSFSSAEDILKWIACQVDETNTFSICVPQTDLYNRGMQQWQRRKKTSTKCRLKVTFFAEAGIDTGALTKEFLTGTGVCPYLFNQTHLSTGGLWWCYELNCLLKNCIFGFPEMLGEIEKRLFVEGPDKKRKNPVTSFCMLS